MEVILRNNLLLSTPPQNLLCAFFNATLKFSFFFSVSILLLVFILEIKFLTVFGIKIQITAVNSQRNSIFFLPKETLMN